MSPRIVPLRPVTTVVTKPKRTVAKAVAKPAKISRNQLRGGVAILTLAGVLTTLSLSHLAEGVAIVAHRPAWEGWSVATAIDLGFIAIEMLPFTCSKATLDDTKIVRHAYTLAVLAASATFNAMAFAEGATTPAMRIAAYALGAWMPAAIGGLIYIAGRCLIGRSK